MLQMVCINTYRCHLDVYRSVSKTFLKTIFVKSIKQSPGFFMWLDALLFLVPKSILKSFLSLAECMCTKKFYLRALCFTNKNA